MNVWAILGTRETSDEREIKRAYARTLKVTRPEDDPQAFQELRDAYEAALRFARHAAEAGEDEEDADPVTVYTAAYQEEPEATVYTAAYEFDPSGADAVPPMVAARSVWAGFLSAAHTDTQRALKQLSSGGDLLNLEVRECFELCAVQYCAGEGCEDQFRVEMAEYFGWEHDCAFIGREMPEETGAAMALLRAHRSYADFRAHADEDEAIQALLAHEVKHAFLLLTKKKFTVRMRELVATIRWQHSEMLYFKLNREVFEAWEKAASEKRYFFDTALISFLAGMVLWLVAVFTLLNIDVASEAGKPSTLLEGNALPAFIVAQALSFGLFAWFAFKGGQNEAIASWMAKLFHDVRFRPAVQHGWIAAFALASLFLFAPNPSKLAAFANFAMMFVCALASAFANSTVFTQRTFIVVGVIAILFGIGGDINSMFTYILAAWCAIQLAYRGGADLFDWLGVPAQWIVAGRAIWLAGVAAIIVYAGATTAPPAAFAACAWLWAIAGMLLARPTIQHFYAVIGAFVGRALLLSFFEGAGSLASQPLSSVVLLMFFIAIFMGVNVFRAKTTQHQFS